MRTRRDGFLMEEGEFGIEVIWNGGEGRDGGSNNNIFGMMGKEKEKRFTRWLQMLLDREKKFFFFGFHLRTYYSKRGFLLLFWRNSPFEVLNSCCHHDIARFFLLFFFVQVQNATLREKKSCSCNQLSSSHSAKKEILHGGKKGRGEGLEILSQTFSST